MPRQKSDRNPFGTILEKTVVVQGKPRKVWDVRKRYAVTDSDGNFVLDARGKKTYKDKTRRCYTKSEALAALPSLPAEISEKKAKTAARARKEENKEYTFSELIRRFRASEVKPAVIVGGKKIAGYKQDLDNVKRVLDLLDRRFGAKILKEITYDDLDEFRTWYSQQKTAHDKLPSVSTINEKMSFLRRLFNFARETGWIDVSPFQRGRSLIDKEAANSRNRMLTFEEEDRLLAACTDFKTVTYERKNRAAYSKGVGREEITQVTPIHRAKLRRLIIAALDTAMRRGELFNLEWWQIDFKIGVIYLTKEAAEKTKTGKKGVLPMTKRLRACLEELAAHQTPRPNQKVFEKYDIRKAFLGACKDAGIDDLQFRDLRSTGATRMVLAGNPHTQVMKVTRHTRLDTFLEHYTNVDIINAQEIGGNLDEFLKKQQRKVKAQVKAKTTKKRDAA
jgi:integrase